MFSGETMKKADAILTADWHLTLSQPPCRIDNYQNTLIKKLKFISDLQKQHDCDVLLAGDLFEHWRALPALLNLAILNAPEYISTIPGNHDLPAHSIDRIEESGYGVLENIGLFDHTVPSSPFRKQIKLHYFPYGKEVTPPNKYDNDKKIHVALIHKYVYKGNKPFPSATNNVKKFMKQLEGYDLIVTGDNHIPFTFEKGKQLLVNPGSLTRHKADQIKHRPRVYLWYAKTNTVEPVYLPAPRNAVSRDHIKIETQQNKKLEAFAKKLLKNVKLGISFEDNINRTLLDANISEKTKQIILEALDG